MSTFMLLVIAHLISRFRSRALISVSPANSSLSCLSSRSSSSTCASRSLLALSCILHPFQIMKHLMNTIHYILYDHASPAPRRKRLILPASHKSRHLHLAQVYSIMFLLPHQHHLQPVLKLPGMSQQK